MRLTTVINTGGLTAEVFELLAKLGAAAAQESAALEKDGGSCPNMTTCGTKTGSCPNLQTCGTYTAVVGEESTGETPTADD